MNRYKRIDAVGAWLLTALLSMLGTVALIASAAHVAQQ